MSLINALAAGYIGLLAVIGIERLSKGSWTRYWLMLGVLIVSIFVVR